MPLAMNYLELIALILAGCAFITAVFAVAQSLKLKKLTAELFAGKKAASLEQFILNQNKKLNDLSSQADIAEQAIQNLADKQKYSIQKIGLVRYNPFEDNGGNLSFSIALLDDHNNGVVITSMHGREHNRIYSKPVKKGKSEFQLTAEEEQAISESKNN